MLAPAPTLLDLMEGQRRADRGMALASGASDPVELIRARERIIEVAKRMKFFFVDDVRKGFETSIHSNAWGSIWRALRNEGLIKLADCRPRRSEIPELHAHSYPVYESMIFGKA